MRFFLSFFSFWYEYLWDFFLNKLDIVVPSIHKSQKGKQKQLPPRIHTSSLSCSSSSSSSSLYPASVSVSERHNHPPVSPSECGSSSSTFPTPLASAFPLPPSSFGIGFEKGMVRGLEYGREKEVQPQQYQQQRVIPLQQQQHPQGQRKAKEEGNGDRPSSSVSSDTSSTDTVVPSSGDGKNILGPLTCGSPGVVTTTDDEGSSMCSGTYYSARSSFSHEGL